MRLPCLGKYRQQGATLVELVMTIVIIGVAIAGVVGAFSLITGRSADPLNQTRAVALAQLYMDEILARHYDESSKVGGGKVPAAQVDCASPGADGETRADYDDVDDYHDITNAIPEDGKGIPLPGYSNFQISIAVACAGNDISEMPLANADAKRIDITITDPSNATYQFSAYRGELLMRRQPGFTLVELVMVIVLLGIVATISVQFVSLSTRGALDVGARQQRALQAVVVSEQISRELRNAFPDSIRIDGECLEWIPIEAATTYIRLGGPDFDRIPVVPFTEAPEAGKRVVVYGYGGSPDDLYTVGSVRGPISSPVQSIDDSVSPPEIVLESDHRFNGQSPERRLYVVGQPVSLCQSGKFLRRYSEYGFNELQEPPPTGTGAVLAANLTGPVEFDYSAGTLERGAILRFAFTLKDPAGDETTPVSQEVQIRNVP